MPEATTDTKGIKKLPKWSYIAIGGGVLVLFLYLKKKKEETPSGSAYTAQSFIPVTGENVAGVGASTGGGVPVGGEANTALIQAQRENTEFLTNFLKTEGEQRKEERHETNEILKGLITSKTGGGTPEEHQLPPTPPPGPNPPPPTPPPVPPVPSPPSPNAGTPGCPAGFPKWNPADGRPSCHSCYRISRERAKKPGYVIHGYCDGREVESR